MIRRSVKVQLVGVRGDHAGRGVVPVRALRRAGRAAVRRRLRRDRGLRRQRRDLHRRRGDLSRRHGRPGRTGCGSTRGGVLVDLRLDKGTQVPDRRRRRSSRTGRRWGSSTSTSRRARDSGPYLAAGGRIARADTRIPVPVATVLKDVDTTVGSVDRQQLVTVVDELGTAFASGGQDLQRLLDAGDQLTRSATAGPAADRRPDRRRQHRPGRPSRRARPSILSFSRDLRLVSGTLKEHDTDVRVILDRGTLASAEVTKLLQDNRTGLSTLLTNLVTVGQVTAANNAGLRQILVTYPDVVAGQLHRAARRRYGALRPGAQRRRPAGLPGRVRRRPGGPTRTQTTNLPPLNTAAHCAAPAGSGDRRPRRPARARSRNPPGRRPAVVAPGQAVTPPSRAR